MLNMTNGLKRALLIGAMATAGLMGNANATPVTVTATNGSNLSAQAVFSVVGGDLQVQLTNVSTFDVLVPANA